MKKLLLYLLIGTCLVSCREDEVVVPTEYEIIPEEVKPGQKIIGMYLLNEGNMHRHTPCGNAHSAHLGY